jgi:peptidoglycan LD-endopeptidase LytH
MRHTALMGSILVVVLFAAYGILTSAGTFPGEAEVSSRSASPGLPERDPTSESSASAPIGLIGPDSLETAVIADEPPLAGRTHAALGGAEESSRTGGSAFTPSQRPLVIPVAGVRPDELVDTYTHARSEGRSHDAIDIMAPHGTPVLAAADGTVLKLFQSDQGGITLYQLDPDQHTIYYYAHLDRYASGIAEGMRLLQGDTIGFVGDTGNAILGNHHLHFEITTTQDPTRYWGGIPINPYPLLRGTSVPRKE